jgi:hypothetical protein
MRAETPEKGPADGVLSTDLRSGATVYLLVAATSAVMGLMGVFGTDPFYGLLGTFYRTGGLLASASGLALWATDPDEMPAGLRALGVVGLVLPWLGLFAR